MTDLKRCAVDRRPNKNSLQVQDCSTGRGPIPPQEAQSAGDMGAGEFQR